MDFTIVDSVVVQNVCHSEVNTRLFMIDVCIITSCVQRFRDASWPC
jgi:hypothetical protein